MKECDMEDLKEKMDPAKKAKKDVLLALKKMAMEMMAEDAEEKPAGVLAQVRMAKLSPVSEEKSISDDVDEAVEENSENKLKAKLGNVEEDKESALEDEEESLEEIEEKIKKLEEKKKKLMLA